MSARDQRPGRILLRVGVAIGGKVAVSVDEVSQSRSGAAAKHHRPQNAPRSINSRIQENLSR